MENNGGDGRSETPVSWKVRLTEFFSRWRRNRAMRNFKTHMEEHPAGFYTLEELRQMKEKRNKNP